MSLPQSLLVAIGGNATHPESIRGTTEEQERVAEGAAQALLPLIRSNNRILITHGNGPVVGKILLRMMLRREQIPPMRRAIIGHLERALPALAGHSGTHVIQG